MSGGARAFDRAPDGRLDQSAPVVRELAQSPAGASRRRRDAEVSRAMPERRVAVYCRVSTERESQESSLENQMKFFRRRIEREPDWRLVEVYADRGITGTSMRNRTEFKRMIEDCEAGKIDTVLTKGVSRFARNTVDLLKIVRRLKERGVNVVFDSQNIDTASEASEMLLTILAAMAQETSRSISDNVRWGNQKRYQMGEVAWHPVYGYRRDERSGRAFLPDGARAAAVRRIFELYVAGYTTLEIARAMRDEGRPAPNARNIWYDKAVCNILANEKYRGDALLQKSFVADVLSHRRVLNDHGERPCYYVEGHHAPLVDPATFDRAQAIRRMRCTHAGCTLYPYERRLICPCCGAHLIQGPVAAQGARSAWYCAACRGFAICTEYLNAAMRRAHFIHEGREVERVAYGWLDEKVRDVGFIARGVCVNWRDGAATQVEIDYRYPRERPEHIAALLRRQLAAEGANEGGATGRDET